MNISRIARLLVPIIAPIIAAAALPSIALAQATPNSFQALANMVAKLLNAGAILLITAALAVYFYNIVGNVLKINRGEGSGADLRKSLWMGLLIIFVMVSIWGIIQILQNTLFGGPGPTASNGVIIYSH